MIGCVGSEGGEILHTLSGAAQFRGLRESRFHFSGEVHPDARSRDLAMMTAEDERSYEPDSIWMPQLYD